MKAGKNIPGMARWRAPGMMAVFAARHALSGASRDDRLETASGLAVRGAHNFMFASSDIRRPGESSGLVCEGEPSLANPVSQGCTQAQLAEPEYAYWCGQIREEPRAHRKQWEFCYILQVLARSGQIASGKRGLGFGVGEEPLTALFAANGVKIVATDLEPKAARKKGWVATHQHAHSKEILNQRKICDPAEFDRLVSFRHADMNAIPADLRDFDFCWSACALEHLGSIARGLRFIENSLECLRPGGIAVHTTEFNCSSDNWTLNHARTVLFRRRDLLALGERLREAGHEVVFNFDLGDQPLDLHVDVPPFSTDHHLKLRIRRWVTTSFGVVVRKAC